MNFQAIRKARKAAGITQEDLAQALGVNRATISKYETGLIEPSVSQIKTIAGILGVDFFILASEIENDWFDEGFRFAVEGEKVIDAVAAQDRKKSGYTFSEKETRLIGAFSSLNSSGQTEAVKRVEELTEIRRYQLTPVSSAPSEGKDTTLPAEAPTAAPNQAERREKSPDEKSEH